MRSTDDAIWLHESSYFLESNSLLNISTSAEAMKLKFECDKFGKRTVSNLQTRMFLEKSRDQIDEITNFINQRLSLR